MGSILGEEENANGGGGFLLILRSGTLQFSYTQNGRDSILWLVI